MSGKQSIPARRLVSTLMGLSTELLRFVLTSIRPRAALVAENLFLRKQLAFYQEREIEPRRLSDEARCSLLILSKLLDWKNALVVVKPETLIGWHRKGFKLFWGWKCKAGRPKLPQDI